MGPGIGKLPYNTLRHTELLKDLVSCALELLPNTTTLQQQQKQQLELEHQQQQQYTNIQQIHIRLHNKVYEIKE